MPWACYFLFLACITTWSAKEAVITLCCFVVCVLVMTMSPIQTAECDQDAICRQTHVGSRNPFRWGSHWLHMANMMDRSVGCSDAVYQFVCPSIL